MPLRTDLTLRLKPALSKVVGGYTLSETPELSDILTLLDGVLIDQADKLYYAKPTIAGSATLTLDLAGGGLVDIYGDAFAPAKLKYLVLKNPGPNIINLVRPASGVPIYLASGDGEPVHVNGRVLKWWPSVAGIPVTAGTGDLIDIVNTAAGSVTPEIWIGAASA